MEQETETDGPSSEFVRGSTTPLDIPSINDDEFEGKKQPKIYSISSIAVFSIILPLLLGLVFFSSNFRNLFVMVSSTSIPTPSPVNNNHQIATPTPDPLADWNIYVNEEFGYSIRYPKDWFDWGPQKGKSSRIFSNVAKAEYLKNQWENEQLFVRKVIGRKEGWGSLSTDWKNNQSFFDTLVELPESQEKSISAPFGNFKNSTIELKKLDEFKLSEFEVVKVKYSFDDIPTEPQTSFHYFLLDNKQNNLFEIVISGVKAYSATIEKMVNSFKKT